jgi:hypothetical protein
MRDPGSTDLAGAAHYAYESEPFIDSGPAWAEVADCDPVRDATLDDWDLCQLCRGSCEIVEYGPLDEFSVPWTETTYDCPRCGGYGALKGIPAMVPS